MNRARKYIRKNIYTPQAALSALDLAGGICSLKAYQIIYMIDNLLKDPLKEKSRRDNTLLPHEWQVHEA